MYTLNVIEPERVSYQKFTPHVPTVNSRLSYLENPGQHRPFQYMYEPEDSVSLNGVDYDVREVTITDARCLSVQTSLHEQGFELWDAPSAITDFYDINGIKNIYYREMAELACLATGARHAYVFDHLVRKRENGRPALTFGRSGDGSNPAPAGRVHNDYTEISGHKRLESVLKDSSKTASIGRFSIINIWRSIKGPVRDTPLAVCDARTVSVDDLIPCDIHYPDRSGEIFLSLPSTRHQWNYFSKMDCHEALIFKQYDSQINAVSRFTPHAAFDLPDTPPDVPLRESIELRLLLTY